MRFPSVPPTFLLYETLDIIRRCEIERNGGGKIEITFYDEKDLGRIYDLIMGKGE